MSNPSLIDVQQAEKRRVLHLPTSGKSHGLARALIGSSGEPSLDAPPVYRHFLAGDLASFVPRLGSLLVLLIVGVGLLGVGWLIFSPRDSVTIFAYLSNAAGALVCAVLLAVLVSRWLGSRLGMCVGYVWLGSIAMLGVQVAAWPAAMCSLTVGLFALANVPSRLASIEHRAMGWAFYGVAGLVLVLFGFAAAGTIFAIGILSLLVSQNVKSVRFFFNPVGVGIFITAIVGRWLVVRFATEGHGLVSVDLGLGQLPAWTPLAVVVASICLALVFVAVAVGFQHGHQATPFGRLVGCWLLGPLVLFALGTISINVALAAALPAGSVLAAVGLLLIIDRIGLARKSSKIVH